MNLYYGIRTLYNEGEFQQSIAKCIGILRQTVKKYCEGNTHLNVRRPYHRDTYVLTQNVTDFIRSCLEEDKREKLNKQGQTAGFRGAESTFRNAVKDFRAAMKISPQTDIPLEHEVYETIQIDWGEATAYISGRKTKFHFFCGRLCYSFAFLYMFFIRKTQNHFLKHSKRSLLSLKISTKTYF